MTDPARQSHELRNVETDDLQRRRWIVGLSLFGSAMGALVYQVGILSRLPDPPGSLFDATKVDASDYAYKRLYTPDGLLMTLTYAVTALLAGAGGMDRSRSRPWLPLAVARRPTTSPPRSSSAARSGRRTRPCASTARQPRWPLSPSCPRSAGGDIGRAHARRAALTD